MNAELKAALDDARGVVAEFRANPSDRYPHTLVDLLLTATERLVESVEQVAQ